MDAIMVSTTLRLGPQDSGPWGSYPAAMQQANDLYFKRKTK